MKKEILDLLFRDVLVELYTDKNDTETFYAGKIQHVSDDHFILQSYTSQGLIDGYTKRTS
jgi:hypothetical protein